MDLEEYKKRLTIEPRGEGPELSQARRESLSHAAAHRAAQDFEDKLEAALRVPVADDAAERIIAHCLGRAPTGRWRQPAWLAIAAVLALAVGIGLWRQAGSPGADQEVRSAFVEHLDYPEPALVSVDPVSMERISEAFAVAGVAVEKRLENVTYLSPCVIGGERGLHLVFTEANGNKETMMIMPGVQLAAAAEFTLPGISARLLPTSMGAIALFGHQRQDLRPLSETLLGSIAPLQLTAAL